LLLRFPPSFQVIEECQIAPSLYWALINHQALASPIFSLSPLNKTFQSFEDLMTVYRNRFFSASPVAAWSFLFTLLLRKSYG